MALDAFSSLGINVPMSLLVINLLSLKSLLKLHPQSPPGREILSRLVLEADQTAEKGTGGFEGRCFVSLSLLFLLCKGDDGLCSSQAWPIIRIKNQNSLGPTSRRNNSPGGDPAMFKGSKKSERSSE